MKQVRLFSTTILLLLVAVTSLATTPTVKSAVQADWQKAEKNYLAALHSENSGLRLSAMHFLGEYRLKGSVYHLITVLQTDKVEDHRMAAACALMKINEPQGVTAVEEAALYDGSEKVSRYCEQLLKGSMKHISLKE